MDTTDIDRKIEGAKALYSQYPLARLKALEPTRENSATEYHRSAILELIQEREQALAADIARSAGRKAWAALGLSVIAILKSVFG